MTKIYIYVCEVEEHCKHFSRLTYGKKNNDDTDAVRDANQRLRVLKDNNSWACMWSTRRTIIDLRCEEHEIPYRCNFHDQLLLESWVLDGVAAPAAVGPTHHGTFMTRGVLSRVIHGIQLAGGATATKSVVDR